MPGPGRDRLTADVPGSVRDAGKAALAALGVYRRRLHRLPYPGVAVLAYHGVCADHGPGARMQGGALHVSVSRLEEQCRALARHCTPITGREFLAIARGEAAAPSRAVLVTFDDGYASMLTHALPVLARHGVPAVVFVCPDPIERQVRFWFDAVAERRGDAAIRALKEASHEEWRRAVSADEMSADRADPHRPLTVTELRELAAHPLVEVGGHTLTHPILARAPEEVQAREIAGSAAAIREWLGADPALFAYPNGRPGIDFTDATIALVAAHYGDAFAVGDAFTEPSAERYRQRRFLMLDTVSAAELAHRLAVSWPRLPEPS
ncbi:MAG: hypothetical protein FJW23_10425 [Acidimicrobiia bacterium]|nr:hypothetical protein [Acidimicrobiia bacterium]